MARSRRLARENKRARERVGPQAASAADSIRAILAGKTEDAIREAFIEELRPVVREAIDEDAVRAIKGMVGLAPAAILVLQEDLSAEDPVLRQRAAALIMKYSLGNPNAMPPREAAGAGLTIINQMPDAGQVDPPVEAEVVDDETRRCESCRLDRPRSAFVADAPVCGTCVEQRKAAIFEAHGLSSQDAEREPSPTAPLQREGFAGRSQVHQVGAGVQPGQFRTTGVVQIRQADQLGTPAFGGPPDPKRWSNGS